MANRRGFLMMVLAVAAGMAVAGERRVEKVVVVSKTHLDLGFTRLPEEVVEEFRTKHFPKALRTAAESAKAGDLPRYVWTVPAWILAECAEVPEVRDGIRSGTLRAHAMPMTLNTSFAGEEDLRRGLGYARRLDAISGRRTRSAKLTDVPGHPWMTPEILGSEGVEFIHIGCNPGHRSPEVPSVFLWQAPTGRKVFTIYSGEYGSGVEPPDDWPFEKAFLAMDMTNDNSGPLDLAAWRRKIEAIRKANPGAEVVSGSLDDFLDAVKDDPAMKTLPVFAKDMGNVWDFCYAGFPKEVAAVREARREVKRLEALAATNGTRSAETEALVAKIYHELTIMSEHSWGGDYKVFLHNWGRGPVDTNLCAIYNSKADFRRLRSDPRMVRMEKSWAAKHDRAVALTESVAQLKAKVERNAGIRAAEPVWAKAPADKDIFTLENDALKVKLDRRSGGIVSLVDRESGREYVDSSKPSGVYVYDVFGNEDIDGYLETAAKKRFDWWDADFGRIGYPKRPRERFRPKDFRAATAADSVRFTLVRDDSAAECGKYGDCRRVTVVYTLRAGSAPLEIEYRFDDGDAMGLVECGSIAFPFAFANPKWRFNTLGTVVDPMKDFARDSGHSIYVLEDWAEMRDDRGGIRISALDTPLVMRGENDIYRFRRDPETAAPAMWFNVFFTKQHRKWLDKRELKARYRVEAL